MRSCHSLISWIREQLRPAFVRGCSNFVKTLHELGIGLGIVNCCRWSIVRATRNPSAVEIFHTFDALLVLGANSTTKVSCMFSIGIIRQPQASFVRCQRIRFPPFFYSFNSNCSFWGYFNWGYFSCGSFGYFGIFAFRFFLRLLVSLSPTSVDVLVVGFSALTSLCCSGGRGKKELSWACFLFPVFIFFCGGGWHFAGASWFAFPVRQIWHFPTR